MADEHNNVAEPTYGQLLSLELSRSLLGRITAANADLDRRVMSLVTLSTAISGVISAAKLLPQGWQLTPSNLLVACSICVSIAVIVKAIRGIAPYEKTHPGVPDEQILHRDYIVPAAVEAANKAITQTCAATDVSIRINREKSDSVDSMIKLLGFQIGLLALAATVLVFTAEAKASSPNVSPKPAPAAGGINKPATTVVDPAPSIRSTLLDCAKGVRDLAVTAAAIAGIFFGFMGLSTWRRQLRGSARYDLACRYRQGAYKLRNGFQQFRCPIRHYPKNSDRERDEESGMLVANKVYSESFEWITKPLYEFEATSTEAEVHWPVEVREVNAGFRKLTNELFYLASRKVECSENNTPWRNDYQADGEYLRDRKRLTASGDQDDEFEKEVETLIAKVEKMTQGPIGSHRE